MTFKSTKTLKNLKNLKFHFPIRQTSVKTKNFPIISNFLWIFPIFSKIPTISTSHWPQTSPEMPKNLQKLPPKTSLICHSSCQNNTFRLFSHFPEIPQISRQFRDFPALSTHLVAVLRALWAAELPSPPR